MSKINETFVGNCNMEVPEGTVPTTGTVPEVYADAINDRRKRVEKIEDDMKDQLDTIDDFVADNHDRENEPKGTSDMKKMKLSEELFEAYIPETKLYKKAERIADDIEEFMQNDVYLDNSYFDDEDRDAISKTFDALNDFAVSYADVMDNEDVFEAVEDNSERKRSRGKKEVKYGVDYSDTDLWLQVYDELDASLENEGEGQQVNRFLKSRKGDRYQYIFVGPGTNDITVGAETPDKFAYAKKVADYYGVPYDEPKEDKNIRTNKYYKWTMTIHIPEDAEPIEKK